MRTTEYDLTVGKPLRRILVFTLPLLIGNWFQQLYNMVDTVIVGQTISTEALSGVAATGAVVFLVYGFIQGLTAGFSVLISQRYGARDRSGVRRALAKSDQLTLYAAVIITAVSVLATAPLLRLMQTPTGIFDEAYTYLVTILWGVPATLFYNLVSNQLRAVGDSRTPLYFLIAASILNVGLDFLLILPFRMGVCGAALATVISQLLAGTGCLAVLLVRYPQMRPVRADFKPDFTVSRELLRLGLPMALQFSITALGVMAQQTALNRLGKYAVAAYTAANKMDNLMSQAMMALGTGVATFCGQNTGACRFDRIRTGVRQSMLLAAVYSLISAVVINALAGPLTRLFVKSADVPLIEGQVRQFLLVQTVFYVFLGMIFVYRNALQGMGYAGLTVIGGVIELVMRVAASFLLGGLFGFTGICFSNPSAWVGAGLFFLPAFLILMKRNEHLPVGREKTD